MESKKLQQIKLANSHLAPQPMPQSYAAASYHPNSSGDYRSPHSPIFQNKPHPSNASNFAQIYLTEHQHDAGGSRQQSNLSHSSGSSQLNIKPLQSSNGLIIGYPQQQQPPPKPQSYYPFDSGTYQNNNRDQQRVYQQAPPTNRSGQQQPHPQNVYHNHPAVSALQQQYQQLQQAKIQQQMQTQNEAIVHSQRTFALRQQLNPPVPQSHFHIQSMSQTQLNQQQQAQSLRNIPPSTLNLTNQFQPATGPVKLQNDAQNIYGMNATNQIQSIDHLSSPNNPNLRAQNQQMLYQQNRKIQQQIIQNKLQVNTSSPSEQTPIIKQNHPGMVVNQASQTQLSDVALKTKSPSTENSSPMHQSLDRKKSFGTIQSLKSPVTKRPSTAPVTLSGWLFKQGSEGLKVWRKRWFVLSEYCLFYYKGSEEEKLLGSILLPSYCVAACSQDDKIYRKFAFKCEHQNMRTYWLAAETAESMGQWVRALTAATMMQGSSESSDQTSQPSVSSLNPSGENSDSGIHTYQSQQSKLGVLPSHGPVTPASDKQVSGVGGLQPLYANAPPKPRRANDGGYSSPSPENSIERYESGNDSRLYHHHHNIHQQPLDTQLFNQSRRSDVKSPMSSHMNDDTKNTHSIRTSDPMIANRLRQMKLNTSDSTANSAHSNFPYGTVDNSILQNTLYASDTYPGSSNNWENIIRAPQRFDDYHTKMYSELHDKDALYMQSAQSAAQAASSYQQYMSSMTQSANAERRTPDTYGRSRAADSLGRNFGDYEDIYNLEQQMNLQNESTAYQRPMSPNITGHFNQTNINAQLTSPISVQMRSRPIQSIPRPHSADFLEYEARHNMDSGIIAEPVRAPRPKSSLDINRTPDNFYYSEASYAEKMRQSALYLQKPSSTSSSAVKIKPDDSPRQAQSYTNTEYPSNTSSMPRESDLHHNNRLEMEALKYSAASSASVPRTQRPYSKTAAYQQQEQFLRSASARLPRKNDDVNSVRDGERKREESMKRLLEWKQRMLQSPLTRKGVPMSIVMNAANSSLSSTHNQHYGMGQGIQRSRSETNANAAAGYNSYSSDDEASISIRNVRNKQSKNPTSLMVDINRNNSNVDLSYYHNMDHLIKVDDRDNYFNSKDDLRYNSQQQLLQQHQSHQQFASKAVKHDIEQQKRDRDTITTIRNLDMSAGDLLSRTHEELVLLLIQLRRQNCSTARSIEQCCTDIHEVQNQLQTCDGSRREENLSRLDTLKQNLIDLEKQYEKSKPLVNLVDNMVKLGSLYRNGSSQSNLLQTPLERLEFNQRVEERRLFQEERKHWDRLSPNHTELQSKVQQLYQLDQLLQEESGTLQTLQRDKEDLEHALGGLRKRLQDGRGPPLALEAARKQQHALERELSCVHQLLAENSKKLEQTVAGNARLEQELLVLRQKLQLSRSVRGSQNALGSQSGGGGGGSGSGGPDSIPYVSGATAVLESELRRVQHLVGDMQRQRHELSQAVQQLTENSNTLYQQIKPKDHCNKKRLNGSSWTETDLDSMISIDHIMSASMESMNSRRYEINSNSTTPLYIDTGSANSTVNILNCSTSSKMSDYNISNTNKLISSNNDKHLESDGFESSGIESDDLLESTAFGNLSNQEKQEIKTVRIVKRESERRHRDRERSSFSTTAHSINNLDQVVEEESMLMQNHEHHNRSASLPRTSFIETHEIYRQTQPEKKSKKITNTLQKPYHQHGQSTAIYSSSSAIPINYTDYYSNLNLKYPVSMSDDRSESVQYENHLLSQSEPNTNNFFNKQPIISNNPFLNDYEQNITASNNDNARLNRSKAEFVQNLTKTIENLSPVFQSEAARQIISEMSGNTSEENTEKLPLANKHKRTVPRVKRRHYTAPNTYDVQSVQNMQSENDMNKNNTNWRARDDLDMEVALRPRINAPDVVRSALDQRDKITENSIDKLFAAPSKIIIPERYIPEQLPELSPEEKKRRQQKVEAIKKMLSETPLNTSNDSTSLPSSQIGADKKQREHLLQLNQILAQQVMQMSKIVAERAMASLPSNDDDIMTNDDEQLSPVSPLPIYQQRENYFT